MTGSRRIGPALAGALIALAVSQPAQSQAPASATAATAKELAALLGEKKFEAFAARVPGETGRFVGAFIVPGVQLLVVSGLHGRSLDAEYYLYNKDFKSAYMDLSASMLVKERVVIDDAMADGLVMLPGKSLAHDSFVRDGARQLFDGDFADPRRKNQKKISKDDYEKAFAEAEAHYTKCLGILIAELKKPGLD
jgi:hypothetical protein